MEGNSVIEVDCRFLSNGIIQVRRIKHKDRWLPIEQGRQWTDQEGKHLLIRVGDASVQELLLRSDTLNWELRHVGSKSQHVV